MTQDISDFMRESGEDSDKALAIAVTSLGENIKNAKPLSDLSKKEVTVLTSLSAVNSIIKSKGIQKWIDDFVMYRISLKRKGRTELKDVAKAVGQNMTDKKMGLLGRIRNFF